MTVADARNSHVVSFFPPTTETFRLEQYHNTYHAIFRGTILRETIVGSWQLDTLFAYSYTSKSSQPSCNLCYSLNKNRSQSILKHNSTQPYKSPSWVRVLILDFHLQFQILSVPLQATSQPIALVCRTSILKSLSLFIQRQLHLRRITSWKTTSE